MRKDGIFSHCCCVVTVLLAAVHVFSVLQLCYRIVLFNKIIKTPIIFSSLWQNIKSRDIIPCACGLELRWLMKNCLITVVMEHATFGLLVQCSAN